MRRRRRTTISREGWCYLLLLACVFTWAILREGNLLLIVAGMLCGPVLCSWRLARRALRGVEVRRRMPHAVYAGEPLVVEIELRNARKRLGCWAVKVTDRVRREDDVDRRRWLTPATMFSYVPAGSSRRRAFHGRLLERGRYQFGPLAVSTRFPFGLLQRTITLDEPDTLTVYPRLGRLTPAWISRRQEALQGARGGRRAGRAAGDFCGVREWQAGDSVRWVHWRSTARHGAVVVCQFEQPRSCDVAILLDLWQPGDPDLDDLEHVELAVSFAATLVADACRRGAGHLCLGITGPEPDLTSGFPSAALMQHVMEKLAVAKASSEGSLPALLELATGQIKPGTEVLLVSTRRQDSTGGQRPGALSADRFGERAASGIHVVNPAERGFSECFQLE